MKPPDSRNPLSVEGGLDGARIRLLVERPGRLGAWARWLPWVGAQQVVELRVDRQGVLFEGRRVVVDADYFGIRIGRQRYEVPGGLTKGEHTRLMALVGREPLGDPTDVPDALDALRE